jgi:hypothetical protein
LTVGVSIFSISMFGSGDGHFAMALPRFKK